MAALDFLIDRGLSAKRVGMRVRISPRVKVTDEVSRYVKQNRLTLLAELTADDGVERRCAWTALVPGYQPFTMIGEPVTRAEALADVRGRWPDGDVL
ncbi:MAG: hypothetical protein M3Q94_03375 [Pseudomonadota bacterium]|nr:hypothetical protein [Pseudomonadota bacterium]